MPWWLDLTTYVTVFGAGVMVGRALVLRTLCVIEHEGHPAIELRHDDERL